MNIFSSGALMFLVTLPLLLCFKLWSITEDHKAILAQFLRLLCGFGILFLLGSGIGLFFEATNGKLGAFHLVLFIIGYFLLGMESFAVLAVFIVILLFGTLFTSNSIDIWGTSGVVLGFTTGCFAYTKIDSKVIQIFDKYLNIQRDKDGLTDIRTLEQQEIEPYELGDYVEPDAVFLGMGEDNNPVRMYYEKFNETNFQIIGYPGAGKGVFAQMVLSQLYNRVVVFDPKHDKYLSAMFANDPKSQFIWLNSEVPQVNLFDNATELEIVNALIEALSMKEKGTDSDVYTLEEQEIIRKVVSEGDRSFGSWLEIAESEHSRSRKVIARFQALKRYGCINGTESLLTKLNEGNIYVIFDESDETQKIIARLIFARLCQIKRNNLYTEQLTLFCDEFIHLVNKSSVNALGLLRSHKMNFMIAHQSLGDFEANFPDVESNEAKQRTLDNTQVKIIYRQLAEAKYWSEMTGTKLYEEIVRDEIATGIRQKFGGIVAKSKLEQKELIDVNEFQTLKPRVAILLGHGLPTKLLTTTPKFDTKKSAPPAKSKITTSRTELKVVDLN